MARLLILIIALNAFITPVSAMGVCEMMDESNSMMMSSSTPSPMNHAMSEMDTGMTCCDPAQCADHCGAAFATPSLLLSEKHILFIVAGHPKPQAGFVYFYTLVHPINTPPPLV